MRRHAAAAIIGVLGALGVPAKAQAYDIDCAIILCMAGGFPPSTVCARAYRTMIRRITPWPSLPPFGVCTFALVPVELGGPGGEGELDTNLPEYEWLNRTKVIWWRMYRRGEREGSVSYDWTLRSCDRDNRNCRIIESVRSSDDPPSGSVRSENGQVISRPISAQRGVMIEFGDHGGNMGNSGWLFY